MKEHTRNLAGIVLLVFILAPYMIYSGYTSTVPTSYHDYDDNSLLISKVRYYNTTGSWLYSDLTETFTANNTFTITPAPSSQDEDATWNLEFWFASTSTESAWFNDTMFETTASDRVTSIKLEIYSNDKTLTTKTVEMGFGTAAGGSDYTIICGSGTYRVEDALADVQTFRAYVPLSAYADIEDNSNYDTAPFRVVCKFATGDASQTFTVKIVFEIGANYELWNQYLFLFGILFCLIAYGMTTYYDMSPKRWSGKRPRYFRRSYYRGRKFRRPRFRRPRYTRRRRYNRRY